MAVPLLLLLVAGYLAIGLFAKEYNWRIRATLTLVTIFVPAGFYFFWT